ncbi:hypothetical protein VTN31DRAFT_1443 [Thermomyces dupontii]|uniref:uncharacterized protein n=1 Tax=Talaromyces thermophilus TaxID=28565 RepID=UPI0037438811
MDARPSSSGGSSQPSYASDKEETTYLSRVNLLHRVRLGLAVLILAVAATIIGVQADPLQYYEETVSFEHIWLPLWPLNLDMRQTKALLSCGAVITFLTMIYIALALVPMPYSRIRVLNMATSIMSIAGIITAIVGVSFAVYLPMASYPEDFTSSETIHSWTCKWKSLNGVIVTDADGRRMLTAPEGFSQLCVESRVGFVFLGLLIGLEVIMGMTAVVGYCLERTVSKQRGLEMNFVRPAVTKV